MGNVKWWYIHRNVTKVNGNSCSNHQKVPNTQPEINLNIWAIKKIWMSKFYYNLIPSNHLHIHFLVGDLFKKHIINEQPTELQFLKSKKYVLLDISYRESFHLLRKYKIFVKEPNYTILVMLELFVNKAVYFIKETLIHVNHIV